MIRMISILLSVALPFLAISAHSQTAVIEGRLLDADGNPIVGYPVILENQTSILLGYSGNIGFTSDTGQFTIPVNQLGDYTAQIPNAPEAAIDFTAPEDMTAKDWSTFVPIGLRKGGDAALPSMNIGTIQLQMQ